MGKALNNIHDGLQDGMLFIFEQAPFDVSIFEGEEFVFKYINRKNLALIQHPADELTGKPLFKVFPELKEQFYGILLNVYKSGNEFTGTEIPVTFVRNGKMETSWYDYTFKPWRNSSAEITGVISLAVDVTEKVLARKRIEASESRYRALTEATTDVVWHADANGNLFPPQPSWQKYTGQTEDEYSGGGWADAVHPDDREFVRKRWMAAIDNKTFYHARGRVWSIKHNGWRYCEANAIPLMTEKGDTTEWIGLIHDVHEKIITEEKLKAAQQQLELTIENIPSSVYLLDGNAKVLYLNKPAIDTMKSVTDDEYDEADDTATMIKKASAHINYYNEDGIELLPEQMPLSIVMKTRKEASQLIKRIYKKNGKAEWFQSKVTPLLNDDGSVKYYLLTSSDVTEQKKSEEQLRSAQQQLLLTIENIPASVYLIDANWKVIYLNAPAVKNFKKVLGESYSADDSIQTTMEKAFAFVEYESEDGSPLSPEQMSMKNLLQPGKEADFTMKRIVKKTGDAEWYHHKLTPLHNEDGSLKFYLLSSVDITAEKTFSEKLEQEVAQRTAQLQKSEKHFSLLFEVSPVAITISNQSNGILRDVNGAWEKLFGFTRNEVIGKDAQQIGISSRQTRSETLKEMMQGGGLLHGAELEFYLPNGKTIFTFTSIVTIELDGVPCLLTAYFDITDRKIAEQQLISSAKKLNEKNLELQRVNKELESFNYIASHDLQEPLRKISTYINLIQKNNFEKAFTEQYFEKILASSDRMSKLIRSVLDYSQLSKNKAEFTEVDLNQVLSDVKNDFELLISEKQAIIKNEKLPLIKANSVQMHQVFSNLISNSLKFSKEKPEIQISAKEVSGKNIPLSNGHITPDAKQKFVQLIFADNGIGFAPEFKEKIFEVFQRLHGKTEYSGTGIGLSIVKKIVEGHGGFINTESKDGDGAVFTLWLPAT